MEASRRTTNNRLNRPLETIFYPIVGMALGSIVLLVVPAEKNRNLPTLILQSVRGGPTSFHIARAATAGDLRLMFVTTAQAFPVSH